MRVVVPENVVFRDLGGEAVLLHLGSGDYFGLDELGTRIWTLVAEGLEVADIERSLLEEYSVTSEQMHGDLRAFLEELCRRDLLECGDES